MAKDRIETDGADMNERLTLAMEAIASRLAQMPAGDSPALDKLTDVFEKLEESQRMIAEGQNRTLRQIHRPSNENPPKISTKNLRGDKDFPRPDLKCAMYIPYPAYGPDLTREEIELLNLLEPGEYPIERNDGSMITVFVSMRFNHDNSQPTQLLLTHETAFKHGEHQKLPFKTRMLRDMLAHNPKTKAAGLAVLTMREEAALIEAGKFNDGREAARKPDGTLAEAVVSVGA